jgi:hypothetical protein
VPDPGVLVLSDRFDITLEAVSRVARAGDPIALATSTRVTMDRSAAAFDSLVAARVAADPQALIYGVTSAPGDRATVALDPQARASRPARLWTAMSYGEPLPERVTRGIVLARLANFLGGHAAVRSQLAVAVADMLDGRRLPVVPAQSNGGSGEILALGTLFHELSGQIELTPKERMALINGSPGAAAARLILAPQHFDVLVASNLHGDVLSDLTGALAGSLGMAPSGNLSLDGSRPSMYEPVHGSAFDLVGRGLANPVGMILSVALMLDDLGLDASAAVVRDAVATTCARGVLTGDVGGSAGTVEVTESILAAIAAGVAS